MQNNSRNEMTEDALAVLLAEYGGGEPTLGLENRILANLLKVRAARRRQIYCTTIGLTAVVLFLAVFSRPLQEPVFAPPNKIRTAQTDPAAFPPMRSDPNEAADSLPQYFSDPADISDHRLTAGSEFRRAESRELQNMSVKEPPPDLGLASNIESLDSGFAGEGVTTHLQIENLEISQLNLANLANSSKQVGGNEGTLKGVI